MEFDQTLKIITEMLQKGEAFISLSPPFGSTIEIDRAVVRKYFKEPEAPKAETEFKEQATEIGELLLPILEGGIDRFINARVRHRFDDKAEKESAEKYREELKRKIEHIRKHLYNDRLQRRYNVKKSSKAPSWSISL